MNDGDPWETGNQWGEFFHLAGCIEKNFRPQSRKGESRWGLVDSQSWGDEMRVQGHQSIRPTDTGPERKELQGGRPADIHRGSPRSVQLNNDHFFRSKEVAQSWEKKHQNDYS